MSLALIPRIVGLYVVHLGDERSELIRDFIAIANGQLIVADTANSPLLPLHAKCADPLRQLWFAVRAP